MVALGHAQQPPIGVPVPSLGEGRWAVDTTEQHKIRFSVVTKGLSHPWAISNVPEVRTNGKRGSHERCAPSPI